jgi:hypothetical protein
MHRAESYRISTRGNQRESQSLQNYLETLCDLEFLDRLLLDLMKIDAMSVGSTESAMLEGID